MISFIGNKNDVKREYYVGSVLRGNEEIAKKLLKVFLNRYFDAHPTKNRMPNSGTKKGVPNSSYHQGGHDEN